MKKFNDFDEAMEYFTKKQKEILDLDLQRQKKMDEYKRETKEYFGFSDGEPLNILQMARLMRTIQNA